MLSWAPEGPEFDSDSACPCGSQASGSDNKARAPGIKGEKVQVGKQTFLLLSGQWLSGGVTSHFGFINWLINKLEKPWQVISS